jgi:hypothetical protein
MSYTDRLKISREQQMDLIAASAEKIRALTESFAIKDEERQKITERLDGKRASESIAYRRCHCEYPSFFETTATPSKKQCSLCGGS